MANNEADMFTKNGSDQSTISMLQGCADMTNTIIVCKMERVMSKGGCQELQSTHDWKSNKSRSKNPKN